MQLAVKIPNYDHSIVNYGTGSLEYSRPYVVGPNSSSSMFLEAGSIIHSPTDSVGDDQHFGPPSCAPPGQGSAFQYPNPQVAADMDRQKSLLSFPPGYSTQPMSHPHQPLVSPFYQPAQPPETQPEDQVHPFTHRRMSDSALAPTSSQYDFRAATQSRYPPFSDYGHSMAGSLPRSLDHTYGTVLHKGLSHTSSRDTPLEMEYPPQQHPPLPPLQTLYHQDEHSEGRPPVRIKEEEFPLTPDDHIGQYGSSPGPYQTSEDAYGPSPPGTGTSTSSNPRVLSPAPTQTSGHGKQSGESNNGSPTDSSKTYSFVSLPGSSAKKRPRRRHDEIERQYHCLWPDCKKAYGTLNHLNAHITMQKHGEKRNPTEFKDLRKQWRKRRKDAELAEIARTKADARTRKEEPFRYTPPSPVEPPQHRHQSQQDSHRRSPAPPSRYMRPSPPFEPQHHRHYSQQDAGRRSPVPSSAPNMRYSTSADNMGIDYRSGAFERWSNTTPQQPISPVSFPSNFVGSPSRLPQHPYVSASYPTAHAPPNPQTNCSMRRGGGSGFQSQPTLVQYEEHQAPPRLPNQPPSLLPPLNIAAPNPYHATHYNYDAAPRSAPVHSYSHFHDYAE